MKIKKSAICLLIVFIMSFQNMNNIVNARSLIISNSSKSTIVAIQAPNTLTNFAIRQFPKLLNSALNHQNIYNFNTNEGKNFRLGRPFNVYNYDGIGITNSGLYYFPVIYNEDIVALLIISNERDSYTASLTKDFSTNLESLLKSNGNTQSGYHMVWYSSITGF